MKPKKFKLYILITVLLIVFVLSLVSFQNFTKLKIYDYMYFIVGTSIKTQINDFVKGLDEDYSMIVVLRENYENRKYKNDADIINAFSPISESRVSSIKTVAAVDLEGNTINNRGGIDNIKDKWYFKHVITEEKFFAQSKDVNGNIFFLVSTPYYADGEVAGAIIGYYYSDALDKLLSTSAFVAKKTLLCDNGGNIILSSEKNEERTSVFDYFGAKKISINKEEANKALNSSEVFVKKVKYEKDKYYVVGEPIGINDWYVVDFFEDEQVEYSTNDIIVASYIEMAVCICIVAAIMGAVFFYDRHRFKLEETYRRQTLQSQLNPHFMFNSLSAICSLINYEPDTAVKMAYDFSKYMRSNLIIINNDSCIPFRKELEHITSFCDIEMVRFVDEVNVKYDIEYEDFKIPPLCAEMLVENAIKYGLRAKLGGGTVTITTKCTETDIVITVKDDGAGYTIEDIEENSVGYRNIDNIKHRLKKLCKGTLTITGVKNEGTVAEIVIPLQNKKGELKYENDYC